MSNIVLPNTLTNGQPNDASQVMADFAAIVSVVNGDIDIGNLATSLKNQFPKLTTIADVKINFGVSATGSFGGGTQIQWTLAHGLGRAPTVGFVTTGGIATVGSGAGQVPIVASINQLDATYIGALLRLSDGSTSNNSAPLYWVVIG